MESENSERTRKVSFATATEEPQRPQPIPQQLPGRGRKTPSRRKTQKGPAQEGQCQFNGTDYPAWLGFDPQKPGGTFKHPFPGGDGDPWEGAMHMMNDHDDDVCDAWNDEIQNLLIFSGLFSAVVTAFAVETQKLLQADPENTTVLLLAQLNNHFLTNKTLTDSLAEPFISQVPNGQTFRINCLIFSSLIISLGTALVGILSLQWVRSLRKVEKTYDRDALARRHARHKAFEKWHVPVIIDSLPVGLGISFIIFLAGLFDFLLSLNTGVAAIIGGLVGLIIIFLLATTFLPALHIICRKDPFPACAYQSAQSLLISSLFIKCKSDWLSITNKLYQKANENVRDGWVKDAIVNIFRDSNSAKAFRSAYLCFQSIPKDEEKHVSLRWSIVSDVIKDSKDLEEIGKHVMEKIEKTGILSSVASSEFFSLLLLLWNGRLGPNYALHRAELNFRCIQTFRDLAPGEYKKLIDLWWRKSAPELSLTDEYKQWRPYLATFLTTLQSTPTDDIKRPLAFSLFWKLIAARLRNSKRSQQTSSLNIWDPKHKSSTNTQDCKCCQHKSSPTSEEQLEDPAQSLAVVQDCLRVLTTWLLNIQKLSPPEYKAIENNQVIRYCLQPMFDYNVFTVDLAESKITHRPSPFLDFLDIFINPHNQRLKEGWTDAIDHAFADKWDDFLLESELSATYSALMTNKKAQPYTTEPGNISDASRRGSPSQDFNTSRTASPDSEARSSFNALHHAQLDALSEVITPPSTAAPGNYIPNPRRPTLPQAAVAYDNAPVITHTPSEEHDYSGGLMSPPPS